MAEIDHQCSICEASFRPGSLDKHGKCPACAKEFPTVKNKQEAMALNKPEIHLGAELTEERVREIVKEELDKILGAEPKKHRPKSETK